jgi:DNA-binding transcriptional MerR regulator
MGMSVNIDIGEVVRRTGVPVSTLHLWERRGLIAPVSRAGLRRQYDGSVVRRIAVIVVCREAGFTLAEIATVLRLGCFADGTRLLLAKLEDITERRRRLDLAIEGIRHALACTEPSLLTCPGFGEHLDAALPLRRG